MFKKSKYRSARWISKKLSSKQVGCSVVELWWLNAPNELRSYVWKRGICLHQNSVLIIGILDSSQTGMGKICKPVLAYFTTKIHQQLQEDERHELPKSFIPRQVSPPDYCIIIVVSNDRCSRGSRSDVFVNASVRDLRYISTNGNEPRVVIFASSRASWSYCST